MSDASEREKELRRYGAHPQLDSDPSSAELAMTDRIVELEERVKHLACPRCLTVNPPEVHTCTPQPRYVLTERWAVVGLGGYIFTGLNESREEAEHVVSRHGVTDGIVRRVALVEETRG